MFLLESTSLGKDLAERRKNQNKCPRCELYYLKTIVKCPHCSELSDYKVKLLIKKRAKERTGLGKYMLFGMLAILIIMYYLNT